MSRSEVPVNPNPAKMFFKFAGSKGKFQYYDKEKKENIAVPLPFRFIVLDTLSTIGGYSKELESGFWSNEVRNTSEEPLVVRYTKGIFAEGLYQEGVKDKIKAQGGKFVQSVYVGYKDASKKLIIANVQMIGSSLSEWIKFTTEHRKAIMDGVVVVKKTKEETNGANSYQVPVFEMGKITEKTNEEAKALDVELQQFFNGYFKTPTVTEVPQYTGAPDGFNYTAPTPDAPATEPIEEDDLPF